MPRADVLYNLNEPLKIESLTLKPPREDEVLVKVAASGVCHSDLSVIKGNLPMMTPTVLGHEGAGIVEEVGSQVKDLKPGDHVVLSWVPNCRQDALVRTAASHIRRGPRGVDAMEKGEVARSVIAFD
jgi:S-(hydroxymethyl)glutathione dehydrogenase/alcohol dehydrogenase